MYQEVGIQKLSPPQIRKLLKGERVIVKKGSDHKLMVNKEQHKKISKAHMKGKGLTIQLDPYAIDMNQKEGSGFFNVLRKIASPVIKTVAPIAKDVMKNPLVKAVAPALLDVGANIAKEAVKKQLLGEGAVKKAPKRRGRPKKGEGFFGDLIKVGRKLAPIVAPVARQVVEPLAQEVIKKVTGRGAKKVKKGEALLPAGYEGGALLPAGYGEGFLDFLL